MTEVFLLIEQFLQSSDGIQSAVRTSYLDITCFILIPRASTVLKAKVAILVVTCFLAYHWPLFTTETFGCYTRVLSETPQCLYHGNYAAIGQPG
jgi:hypothetical protein